MNRSEKNNEAIENIHFKLQRDYSKLNKINNWFQEKKDAVPNLDYVTLGTRENNKVLLGSASLPGAFLAVGLASLVAGMVVIFPLIGGPGVTEQEIEVFGQMKNVGNDILNFAEDTLTKSWNLASIPAGVVALSIPKTLFNNLANKVDKKTRLKQANNEQIIKLINDLLEEKEDETLEFPKIFLRRVDLSQNSIKFNIDLFSYLAYYRYCLQKKLERKMNDEDVKDSFDAIIYFLEDARYKHGVSKNFKNNRFVKMLIDESGYVEADFHKTSEEKTSIRR